MALKDEILGFADLKPQPVDVPEWGRTLYVRTMTAAERDEWEQWLYKHEGQHVATAMDRVRMVILATVDEKGARVFTEADADALGRKNANALHRIFNAALKLNALESSEVEARAKN